MKKKIGEGELPVPPPPPSITTAAPYKSPWGSTPLVDLRCDHDHPPTVKADGDIGFDLYAPRNLELEAYETVLIPSGVFVERIATGYWLRIVTKSSSPRLGYFCPPAGVIDTGYTGELGIYLFATKPTLIVAGTPIAQVVIHLAIYPQQAVTVNGAPLTLLQETERGQNGGLWAWLKR